MYFYTQKLGMNWAKKWVRVLNVYQVFSYPFQNNIHFDLLGVAD